MRKTIAVVGGPISQKIDPVLSLVPSGKGKLAENIASELENDYDVLRIGNYDKSKHSSFEELENAIGELNCDCVVFLAHLPNILVDYNPGKIRPNDNKCGTIDFRPAPKLVKLVKTNNPKTLLIPFKLADVDMPKTDIINWMLNLCSPLAVYSRLGIKNEYTIIDVLGNEIKTNKEQLPSLLLKEIKHHLEAVRYPSTFAGSTEIFVPYFEEFASFTKKVGPMFSQLTEKNVNTDRWPGNFSMRAEHPSFFKSSQGFFISRRNVSKTNITISDFVFVDSQLIESKIAYYGRADIKPSVDSPIHRIIYNELPWVNFILHGHIDLSGNFVHPKKLMRWPCGSENEGWEIVQNAPNDFVSTWAANINGHGFIALIGDEDPKSGLETIAQSIKK